MFRIDPHTLYTRADLVELLRPLGIDADGWLGRLRPVKRFRRAWWGEDLIEAIRRLPCGRSCGKRVDNPRPAA